MQAKVKDANTFRRELHEHTVRNLKINLTSPNKKVSAHVSRYAEFHKDVNCFSSSRCLLHHVPCAKSYQVM